MRLLGDVMIKSDLNNNNMSHHAQNNLYLKIIVMKLLDNQRDNVVAIAILFRCFPVLIVDISTCSFQFT